MQSPAAQDLVLDRSAILQMWWPPSCLCSFWYVVVVVGSWIFIWLSPSPAYSVLGWAWWTGAGEWVRVETPLIYDFWAETEKWTQKCHLLINIAFNRYITFIANKYWILSTFCQNYWSFTLRYMIPTLQMAQIIYILFIGDLLGSSPASSLKQYHKPQCLNYL